MDASLRINEAVAILSGQMKMKPISPDVLQHVPCVLKLAKHKFACYVERYVGRVPLLDLPADAVKICSRRKKAWRTALAMARACRKLQRRG